MVPTPPNPPRPRPRFDPLVYVDPRPNRPLIHALGQVNRGFLASVLKLRAVELPAADLARLRSAVRPGTAAFLGPGHPEFMTDWLLDKEISRRCSPLMAHWASYEIVNASPLAQAFWLRNNLISNAPGGRGKEYSIDWALAGYGVLLHPEGTASWHGDTIEPLLPGIVDMAWEACARVRAAGRETPVFIVPLIWKLHFTGDASAGLAREMRHIERALTLPEGAGRPLEQRFALLLVNALRRQCERFGFGGTSVRGALTPERFFDAQEAFASFLRAELERRLGPLEDDVQRAVHAARRAIRERAAVEPEVAREARKLVAEFWRCHGFTREHYGAPHLVQEQIAESLKRLRSALVTRGFANALHNTLPIAVAPRIARVRVPEPIAVHEAFVAGDHEAAERRGQLLAALRERMQQSLDALNGEIEPGVQRWRRPNPMAGSVAAAVAATTRRVEP